MVKSVLIIILILGFLTFPALGFFIEPGIDIFPRSQYKKTIGSSTFKYKATISNFSLRTGITREEVSVGLIYSRTVLNFRYRIFTPANIGSTGNL